MAKRKKTLPQKNPLKKQFTVDQDKGIDACLDQMKKEGYAPVRRMEQPVFKEGEDGPEVIGQMITFEGRLIQKDEQ
ncbi:NETI motif-containing protein [Terrilactibacillus sp. BCM23-1]|uniref:NETI motif-containing protein n=1 Tax=Terrilactibacillus tamarindi TaxID=2599694 RepID=A0A6N8CV47_9BACI|nr:NETI motif-containing protein [Terrilactibacillus tamarindi]MTT33045.1 NETI motif-containing protein [Terrilactibacillus tamarindi]